MDGIMNFFETVKDFLFNKDNIRLVIIISVALVLFLAIVTIAFLFNAKKKKYRKSLDLLRNRILTLKQKDVITNYSTYDNLKNDQKLGMLVLRWKKSIENLVREIDAQYSMLDVLEDAIDSNNYQYFTSLLESIYKDLDELENKADKLHDEIIEYVDIASDNRKYINKYLEMSKELKEKYLTNQVDYEEYKEKIEEHLQSIDERFRQCQGYIDNSMFVEADNVAAAIFKDIKLIDNFLELSPKINNRIKNQILPKFAKLQSLRDQFGDKECQVLKLNIKDSYDLFFKEVHNILDNVKNFIVDIYDLQFSKIDEFLDNSIKKFDKELENKENIIRNIKFQTESLAKIEGTAKNFISIFKVVQGSYNITNKEIVAIEQLISSIEKSKMRIVNITLNFEESKNSHDELLLELEITSKEITKMSKQLDTNINIIDEIYSDEKNAREKISLMTEKINGTKKYLKVANLEGQANYLEKIKNLNLELAKLYTMLSSFPIDIVYLNQTLEGLVKKVEQSTQEINGMIYKTLLTEYALLYANRYFTDLRYQKDLMIAENLFYNNNVAKAYDKIISTLDLINPNNRKLVLEKYQEKFSEIFK